MAELATVSDRTSVALDDIGTVQRIDLQARTTSAPENGVNMGAHDYATAVSANGRYFGFTNGASSVPVWYSEKPQDSDRPDLVAQTPGLYPDALAVASDGTLAATADSGTISVSPLRSPTADTASPERSLFGVGSVNSNGLALGRRSRTGVGDRRRGCALEYSPARADHH